MTPNWRGRRSVISLAFGVVVAMMFLTWVVALGRAQTRDWEVRVTSTKWVGDTVTYPGTVVEANPGHEVLALGIHVRYVGNTREPRGLTVLVVDPHGEKYRSFGMSADGHLDPDMTLWLMGRAPRSLKSREKLPSGLTYLFAVPKGMPKGHLVFDNATPVPFIVK